MGFVICVVVVFFFKQKTAYEMRISDWSSDVCSSDLEAPRRPESPLGPPVAAETGQDAGRQLLQVGEAGRAPPDSRRLQKFGQSIPVHPAWPRSGSVEGGNVGSEEDIVLELADVEGHEPGRIAQYSAAIRDGDERPIRPQKIPDDNIGRCVQPRRNAIR